MTARDSYADILDADGFPLTPDRYLAPAYSESGELSLDKARQLAARYDELARQSWEQAEASFRYFDPYRLLGGMSALYLLGHDPDLPQSTRNLGTKDQDIELTQILFETFLPQGSAGNRPALQHVLTLNFHVKLLIRNVHIQELVDNFGRFAEHGKNVPRMLLLSFFSELQRRSNTPVTTRTLARRRAAEYAALLDFEGELGMSGPEAVALLTAVGTAIEDRFNRWLEQTWEDRSPEAELPDGLPECFLMTEDDLADVGPGAVTGAAAAAALRHLCHEPRSIGFDDLAQTLLERPVRGRPFAMTADGGFLCSCPDSLILEPILLVTELAGSAGLLTAKTLRRIAQQLEGAVLDVVEKALPSASVFASVKWRRRGDPAVFEADLLASLAGHLLVIEAKSGRVTPGAHEGKKLSLKKDVGKLVDYATDQTYRFIESLADMTLVKGMPADEFEALTQTAREKVHPLVVTHEQLGVLGADFFPGERDTTRPMSLGELQLVMDILRSEAERLYYLRWRTRYSGLFGSELHLMDRYLQVTARGEGGVSFERALEWMMPYHQFTIGEAEEPPHRAMTPRWQAILATFDRERYDQWLDASFALLGFDYPEQQQFEEQLDRLRAQVAQQVGMRSPVAFSVYQGRSLGRSVALCPGICVNTDSEQRHAAMASCAGSVLETSPAEEVLVFAVEDRYEDPDFTGFLYATR